MKDHELLLTRTYRRESPAGVLLDDPNFRWEIRYTRRPQ
jgi:hypothetical protein